MFTWLCLYLLNITDNFPLLLILTVGNALKNFDEKEGVLLPIKMTPVQTPHRAFSAISVLTSSLYLALLYFFFKTIQEFPIKDI